jgi:hypothetical protein
MSAKNTSQLFAIGVIIKLENMDVSGKQGIKQEYAL